MLGKEYLLGAQKKEKAAIELLELACSGFSKVRGSAYLNGVKDA